MAKTELRHRPYTNARGERIDNGTSREAWCGWEYRDDCPLCCHMWEAELQETGLFEFVQAKQETI